MQIHNSNIKGIFISKFLFDSFLCILIIFLFLGNCFSLDLLEKTKSKLEKNIESPSATKVITKDIYNSTLNKIKYDEIDSISYAVNQTTTTLNNRYICRLSDSDIVNILYFSDMNFKNTIDISANKNLSKPTKQDMQESCVLFNSCYQLSLKKDENINNHTCLGTVSDIYQQIQKNKYLVSTIDSTYKGLEYLWNGTLDDSPFDLLLDIYDISNILFGEKNTKKPPEVVFFNMPKLNNVDGVYDSSDSLGYYGQKDWFSPEQQIQFTGSGTTGNNSINSGNNSAMSGGNINNNDGNIGDVNVDIGDDIWNFINTVNSQYNESANSITNSLGNNCISGFSYQFYTGYITNQTGVISEVDSGDVEQPQDYIEEVIDDIEHLKCNNDLICDEFESRTCPDCSVIDSGSDIIDETVLFFDSISGVLSGGDDLSENVKSCVNKCISVQTDVSAELLCVANCFCVVVESENVDGWPDSEYIPSFKMKFCTIPAVAIEKPAKEKVVYSIQEIFESLYDIAYNLKNGGEILVATRTRSWMDNIFAENRFSDIFSFLVTFNMKNHPEKVSESTKRTEQIKTNTQLNDALLNLSDKSKTIKEEDKYIVAESSFDTSNEKSKLGNDVVNSYRSKLVVSVGSRFSSFLSLQSNFWKNMSDIMESINEQSLILYDKR